jgi:N-acylneuraminate cytidylyltransferase
MERFTAIIPVRQGSRRLKNKNIMPFGDDNLLIYKIKQLKTVKEIGNIVVSSDSDEMLKMASDLSVNTHKRAEEYCDEKSQPFGAVVAHICENVEGNHIIWATCTSPLVEPSDYRKAINKYNEVIYTGYDSLMSVEEFHRHIWNENGPINYELGIKHIPSQQLPPLYRVTDGILIAPRQKMIEWKYFHGTHPYKFIMDKRASIDIDDVYDLECAKAWLVLLPPPPPHVILYSIYIKLELLCIISNLFTFLLFSRIIQDCKIRGGK